MPSIDDLGWSAAWADAFGPFRTDAVVPARVTAEHRSRYEIGSDHGPMSAQVSGRLRHEAATGEACPVVGDWVVVTPRPAEGTATIHHVLPRRTALVRQAVDGVTAAQALAANVDTVFVVTSLNRDFNPRRIERYLTTIWESGAAPVLILSKADLCDDVARFEDALASVALGVPIHTVSALAGEGLDALDDYLEPGRTVTLVGSSGAGKSTLINRLAGETLLVVKAIRADDDRGRHTTTHRQLVRLASGALVIDTPGLRELALWDSEGGLQSTFADIEELATGCRFADCRHQSEPGCAVRRALDEGHLERDRLRSYRKLERELAYLHRRQDHRARVEEQRRWKRITKAHRERTKRLKER